MDHDLLLAQLLPVSKGSAAREVFDLLRHSLWDVKGRSCPVQTLVTSAAGPVALSSDLARQVGASYGRRTKGNRAGLVDAAGSGHYATV